MSSSATALESLIDARICRDPLGRTDDSAAVRPTATMVA
jgi:hypothetical protein